jgi:hypothetical protein
MLALAHAAESLTAPESPLFLDLATRIEPLDLVREADSAGWPTREGNFIQVVKTVVAVTDAKGVNVWKDLPTAREPVRLCFKALALFERLPKVPAAEAKDLVAECRASCIAAASADPSCAKLLNAIKSLLESKKPCKWCEGAHERRCMNGCNEKGEKLLRCTRCNGLGYSYIRGRRIDCPQTPPKGKEWENGHTCMWPCPKCEGKALVECKDCKEPWSGKVLMEGLRFDPCDVCDASGWLVPSMKLACYECYATGKRIGGLKR